MKVKKQKVSPRQKMINLMYVLLMAMLAMNVSSDVLNGFTLVDESLTRSTENAGAQNNTLYGSLGEMMTKNPEKVREWFERAGSVKAKSDSLYSFADDLKVRIAKEADGKDADYRNLENREDLEAATFVMLTEQEGAKLYNQRLPQLYVGTCRRPDAQGDDSQLPEHRTATRAQCPQQELAGVSL